jgi:hypothetical protein
VVDPSDEFLIDHLREQSEILISLFSAMNNLGAFEAAKVLPTSFELKNASDEPNT